MKNIIKKNILFVFLLAYFLPATSLAAQIFLTANKNNFVQNEDFLVKISLNTENVPVNAVEGTVVFPTDLLDLKEIRDGNSAINFWVERPHADQEGQVVFSGITTGGFSGPDIFLFSLVLHSKAQGSGMVATQNLKVLQNDGLGTEVFTAPNPFIFSVSSEKSDSENNLTVQDSDPPEDFTPYVAQDPSIYDGKYFVVFSTVDKGVGIDHYEIHEGFLTDYEPAVSPYLLKDQDLSKNIYIRAVDKSGNQRLEEISMRNPKLVSSVTPISITAKKKLTSAVKPSPFIFDTPKDMASFFARESTTS